MTQRTWGIVQTTNEPAALTLANVGWHLGTGASEVHVYLDDPLDPVAKTLRSISGVHVTICDDAYWASICKSRPEAQTQRQFHNAKHAIERCDVAWLAHVDADEFLFQHRPLETELPFVRELDCELHFPVSERFYLKGETVENLFDGVLCRSSVQHADNVDRRIYGDKNRFLARGLTGHCGGKTAVPTDSNFLLGIHSSHRGKRGTDSRSKRFCSTTTRVFHFDGLTAMHWLVKIAIKSLRLTTGRFPKARVNQIQSFLDHCDDYAEAMGFHDMLRCMDAEEIARMDGFGLLEPERFDPRAAITQGLGWCPDLSVESFDAEIARQYPELFAQIKNAKLAD